MTRFWGLAVCLLLPAQAFADPISLSALCPKPIPGEITICADRDPPRSPYRIPKEIPVLPEFGSRESRSVSAERNSLFDFDAGGTGTCSTVGPGGASGCLYRRHLRNENQRSTGHDRRGALYDDPGY